MDPLPVPEANCAICGAPPFPECPHEGERLELALHQALVRWTDGDKLRNFVLDASRNQVIAGYNRLRSKRAEEHQRYLETNIPFYNLYHKHSGNPPLEDAQIRQVLADHQKASEVLQSQIDRDWETSCARYPEVLKQHFDSVGVNLPPDDDPLVSDPLFGAPGKGPPDPFGPPRKDSVEISEGTSAGTAAPDEVDEQNGAEEMAAADDTSPHQSMAHDIEPKLPIVVPRSGHGFADHERAVVSNHSTHAPSLRARTCVFTSTLSRDETRGGLAAERKLLRRLKQNERGFTASRTLA